MFMHGQDGTLNAITSQSDYVFPRPICILACSAVVAKRFVKKKTNMLVRTKLTLLSKAFQLMNSLNEIGYQSVQFESELEAVHLTARPG